jgi:hypothetical protein
LRIGVVSIRKRLGKRLRLQRGRSGYGQTANERTQSRCPPQGYQRIAETDARHRRASVGSER